MRSTKSCLLLLAVVFSSLAPTHVLCAQDVPPEWKKIRAALEMRREKFSRFSCRLETVRLAPIYLYEGLEGDPVIRTEGKQDIHIDLKAGSVRYEDETPRYYKPKKKFVTRYTVNVCDGKEFFTFYPRHETWPEQESRPFHLIKGHLEAGGPLTSVTEWSLLRTFGVLRPSDFLEFEITDLPRFGFKFQRQENRVTATGQFGPRTITTIVFDESKDFYITQISSSTINGDMRQDTKYAYVKQDGDWRISGWLTTFRESGYRAVEVKQFQNHDELDPKLFKVPEDYLKPGMTYADSSTPGAPGFYFVDPDGELKPLFDRRGRRLDREAE